MVVFTRHQFSGEKGICHMTKTTITPLPDPSGFSPDPLTDTLRSGARRLIEQAVEAEQAALLAAHADDKTEDGRSRLVRHGYLPEREVMTGIGPVPVKVPRVRDRTDGAEKVRFTSAILPPYLRKAKSIEELLPWLYSRASPAGISRKRSQRFWGRTRRGCPRPPSRGSRLRDGTNTSAGSGATSAPGGSSISGPTAFVSGCAWRRKSNAFWS